jgi:hypothetical protein
MIGFNPPPSSTSSIITKNGVLFGHPIHDGILKMK